MRKQQPFRRIGTSPEKLSEESGTSFFPVSVLDSGSSAKNQLIFKVLGISSYFAYVLICVYVINGARGFWPAFWQMFGILSIVNVIDRLLIDEYWVGHTKAWEIPGTEDMKPYINRKDKIGKWLIGTVGFALLCAILAGIMTMAVK